MEGDGAGQVARLGHAISTHALTWRATVNEAVEQITGALISTHALTWRATAAVNALGHGSCNFYPRPHMEGDIKERYEGTLEAAFLPTPSHGGRRLSFRPLLSYLTISTHALTWRATAGVRPYKLLDVISTHALTWRATYCAPLSVCAQRDFYPRPHMEGDLWCVISPAARDISTHALTWRATANMLKCRRAFQQLI